jgi:sigma-54 specific flagellar transcriptional regulator A
MPQHSVQILGKHHQSNIKVASMLEFLEINTSISSRLDKLVITEGKTHFSAHIIVCQDIQDLHELVEAYPEITQIKPCLLFTAQSITPDNVTTLPDNIADQLPLPCTYRKLKTALQQMGIHEQNSNRSRRRRQCLESLEGHGPAISKVKSMIEKVAPTEASVLILGESGTGKELVARALHRMSDRADQPFVPVNCGAIPKELLESELFGHEKGAFTGAISNRIGRFELANGGTLFLDEIGDMDFNMQIKLLRVLQEKTFERVGSNRSLVADVRILAATHRNLEDAIADGKFREDLYYRLNVFPIDMPPLRDRREDIPALANSMINRLANERGNYSLHNSAMNAMMHYHWPGNVRELNNLVERMRILFPGKEVHAEDLPDAFTHDIPTETLNKNSQETEPKVNIDLSSGEFHLKEHLQDIELKFIKQALKETKGVVAQAAKRLNLRRTTLVEKMRKYHLERDD